MKQERPLPQDIRSWDPQSSRDAFLRNLHAATHNQCGLEERRCCLCIHCTGTKNGAAGIHHQHQLLLFGQPCHSPLQLQLFQPSSDCVPRHNHVGNSSSYWQDVSSSQCSLPC